MTANENSEENKNNPINEEVSEQLNEEILNAADEIISESEQDQIEDKQADLLDEISQLKEQVLRHAANTENIRRRSNEEVQKARNYSIESFAKDLLGVVDNLHRATESVSEEEAKENEKIKSILEGVKITQKEMLNIFERNNIKCVNPVGELFNPDLHQAMSQIDDAEKESGAIVEVLQTGYTIKDRLIRPALVIVVK